WFFDCKANGQRRKCNHQVQPCISNVVRNESENRPASGDKPQEGNQTINDSEYSTEQLRRVRPRESCRQRWRSCEEMDRVMSGIYMKDSQQVFVLGHTGHESQKPDE